MVSSVPTTCILALHNPKFLMMKVADEVESAEAGLEPCWTNQAYTFLCLYAHFLGLGATASSIRGRLENTSVTITESPTSLSAAHETPDECRDSLRPPDPRPDALAAPQLWVSTSPPLSYNLHLGYVLSERFRDKQSRATTGDCLRRSIDRVVNGYVNRPSEGWRLKLSVKWSASLTRILARWTLFLVLPNDECSGSFSLTDNSGEYFVID
jgi:hypothetical protein